MANTEIWITPLLLLPGVALLIVSTAARFGQLQDEFHHLLDHEEQHAKIIARPLVQRAYYEPPPPYPNSSPARSAMVRPFAAICVRRGRF